MAVIIKNLASGSATSTHQPGTGKSWIVKNIIVTNTGTSATLTLKAVGKFIAPSAMALAANTTVVFNDEITLTETESLAFTITGTADYVVNGVERDV